MNLSDQSKELLNNSMQLRKFLSQIFPTDLVEYLMVMIAKDQAHQNLLKFIKD